MRTIFKIAVCVLTISAYGQQADSFSFVGNAFDQQWSPKTTKVEGQGVGMSNAINAGMFNDFVFRTGFTPAYKDHFVNGTQNKVNIYSLNNADAEYKLDSNWGLYLNSQTSSAYTGNKEISDLLFFGNAPFLDQSVSTENLKFIRYSGVSIGATHKINISEKAGAKVLIGLRTLFDYRAVSIADLSLYTSPTGAYVDAETSELHATEESITILKGIGLDLGFDVNYVLDAKNSLAINVRDVNLTRLLNYTSLQFDTSLRFTGVGYDIIADTNSLENFVDSVYVPIVQNARKESKWTSLPSRINLKWNHRLSEDNVLSVGVQTVNFGSLGVMGTVGLDHTFSDRFRLRSTLGYGNFSGVLWTEAAEYRLGNYNVFAGITGLHLALAPKMAGSYGVSIGAAKQF